MFCTINQKAVQPAKPSDTTTPQYPADFFNKNNHQKPTVRVTQRGYKIQELREIISNGIVQDDLNSHHVVRYMELIMEDITDTLDEDWNSFGVKIGRKGDKITPLSLVNVMIEEDELIDGKRNNGVNKKDDKWIMLVITSYYRFAFSQNQNHRSNLITKLNLQLRTFLKDPPTIVDNMGLFTSLISNINFTKLISALDMFLNRFKNNDWSYLRFGTIASRYKDCSALMSLSHVCDVTGMKMEEFMDWIFVYSTGEDMIKLMKEGNEIDNPMSYMPYTMSMGLSTKSPYSSINCPSIYSFIHMLGSFLGSERSRNARMVSENNIVNLKVNAGVVSYVKSHRASMIKAFISNDVKEQWYNNDDNDNENGGDDESDEELDEMPKGDNPVEWFMYLESRHFELPEEIKNFMNREARKITNPRVGTIGKFVSTMN
ncbi:nucleocapsid protein [Adelaide River virus]|uniref:Nucleoprotein n=2 Tax=Adelaide River virus TaxID=31612 RepID=NCAP_ARV|nr:nucleocapsid protein [Adelaide River virus]Q65111.1 RecName: Full=Nucleoprotein; Short=NP; AltName: Full=Nucleocapsid protein; Short=Protein N [Adelaide River virus]AAC54627.1 nucleoprotein N [Adelaide River virus]AFR23533.1 nucleocapsid protein [Adelaide River virus]prf//2109368A nucleoprotein [Adelaide River virus]